MENKKITSAVLRKLIIKEAYRLLKEEGEEFDDNDEDGYSDNDEKYSHERFKDSGDDVDIDVADEFEETPEVANKRIVPNILNKQVDDNTEVIDYSNVSVAVNTLSKGLTTGEIKVLNKLIGKAINTGNLGKDFSYGNFNVTKTADKKEVNKSKVNIFNYVTTVLATLYKNGDVAPENKSNIKNALRAAIGDAYSFSGERTILSKLASNIARNARIDVVNLSRILDTVDGQNYLDIINDSIDESFDYVLENYDKERGGLFPSILLFNAAGRVMTEVQSKRSKSSFSTAIGGSGYLKSKSLDEPIGTEDDENTETLSDKMTGAEGRKSDEQKDAASELKHVVNYFVTSRLKKNIEDGAIPEDCLTVYEMLSHDNSLSEIADKLGRTDGSVRQLKGRLQDVMTEYVKNGSFQRFIKNKTGIKVNFPNNEFFVTIQGTTVPGETEENTLEYFEQSGIDPATGEPKGEMVPVTIGKEDNEDSRSYDWNIGDIALKGDAETRAGNTNKEINPEENQDDLGPDDLGLNETFISKQLMKLVNKRILKEFKK